MLGSFNNKILETQFEIKLLELKIFGMELTELEILEKFKLIQTKKIAAKCNFKPFITLTFK